MYKSILEKYNLEDINSFKNMDKIFSLKQALIDKYEELESKSDTVSKRKLIEIKKDLKKIEKLEGKVKEKIGYGYDNYSYSSIEIQEEAKEYEVNLKEKEELEPKASKITSLRGFIKNGLIFSGYITISYFLLEIMPLIAIVAVPIGLMPLILWRVHKAFSNSEIKEKYKNLVCDIDRFENLIKDPKYSKYLGKNIKMDNNFEITNEVDKGKSKRKKIDFNKFFNKFKRKQKISKKKDNIEVIEPSNLNITKKETTQNIPEVKNSDIRKTSRKELIEDLKKVKSEINQNNKSTQVFVDGEYGFTKNQIIQDRVNINKICNYYGSKTTRPDLEKQKVMSKKAA